MPRTDSEFWTSTTDARLASFLDSLGTLLWDSRQRHSFATYALGLLSDLERKTAEAIAAAATTDPDDVDSAHQRLLHCIADAPWPDEQVRLLAARYALGPMTARSPVQTWSIDDTGFLKSGPHSVGVQRQYTGSAGKITLCQTAVSLTLGTAYSHLPVDLQLYLPQSWLDDAVRRKRTRIPESAAMQTKPQMAIEMLKRAVAADLPRGVVLADAAYGDSAAFRAEVRALLLHYVVGVHRTTRVIPAGSAEPVSIQALVDSQTLDFRRVQWREGSGKRLSARFAFVRVQVPQDAQDASLWLIVEWRTGEATPERAYLASLPSHTSHRRLVYLLKERYRVEQSYREMKQELGLAHYEGRSYTGWNHHVSVVLSCYAFVVAERDRAFPPSARRELRFPWHTEPAQPLGENG